MSTARRESRSRVWLRVVVLLLALLVPGVHAQAHALPVAVTAGAEAVEHDTLDAAVRPAARSDRRAGTRRPVRRCAGPPHRPVPAPVTRRADRPAAVPVVPPLLRTVVLRC
ncbi:hypothetical protein ACFV46_25155 [Streptomyces sp. NPDC059852]|uniref:hypothetical protein n=1 Tax=Streptomyces sp. NPDC059852 TaxID=3346972 RepID=UPI00364ECEDC